jgi:galactokinase
MLNKTELSKLHFDRFKIQPDIAVAPGRVNLIGEHTDYADGFVMPVAIDFATLATISPRSDGQIVIHAVNFDEERSWPLNALPKTSSSHWSDYPLGVLAKLAERGIQIPAFSLTIWGDVPLGSGLSSSASLEVATATAVLSLVPQSLTGPEVALLCQKAENEFVGSSCGIMDQFISANGKADSAMLLDCRSLEFKLAPIPHDIALVIVNTMKKHSIVGGDYPTRRKEVEQAADILRTHRPEIVRLRDATLEDLDRWGNEMPEHVLRRAKHVISDSLRAQLATKALGKGDLVEVGRLMADAHRSYRDDFEASCPEADLLVELANTLPGLVGARLTGGGWGGCTINLVHQKFAAEFAAKIGALYEEKTGIKPQIHLTHASDGAHLINSEVLCEAGARL